MILLYKIENNQVMRDIQFNDWDKQTQLADAYSHLNSLPASSSGAQEVIDALEADKEAWYTRRKQACAKMYGGVASDYGVIQVPEDEKASVRNARYIMYDGKKLSYVTGAEYTIDGPTITVNPGWVFKNERLMVADTTDFSILTLSEPQYFQMVYARNIQTSLISVQIRVRYEDEEFAPLPVGLELIRPIIEGIINIDNTITITG